VLLAFCLLTVFLLSDLAPVQADVVVLKNCDWITGSILKMENKPLEIEPP